MDRMSVVVINGSNESHWIKDLHVRIDNEVKRWSVLRGDTNYYHCGELFGVTLVLILKVNTFLLVG